MTTAKIVGYEMYHARNLSRQAWLEIYRDPNSMTVLGTGAGGSGRRENGRIWRQKDKGRGSL